MEMTMTTFMKTAATVLALSIGAATYTSPAEANANDAIIAGAAGFAVGAMVGGARPRYYNRGYYAAPAYYPRAYYAPRRGYYPRHYRYPVHNNCYNNRDCW